MKINLKLFVIGLIIIIVAGCSGYEKLLKGSDYKAKYREAMRYYQKENYVRSATLFDQIASVYRGTDQADTIYYYQAMSYYNQGDYILSGHYFRTFAKTYGGSHFAEESDYLGAYCYYRTSPRPELDQENTVQALQAFQLHLIRFPASKRTDEVIGYLDELKNKLVEKSYLSARLYFDLEDYKASIVALNNSIIQYPDSKYREEIMYMMVKASYLLAAKSVRSKQKERYQDTIDEYYSFATEFPNSSFIKEAEKYYNNATKFLGDEVIKPEEN